MGILWGFFLFIFGGVWCGFVFVFRFVGFFFCGQNKDLALDLPKGYFFFPRLFYLIPEKKDPLYSQQLF